MGIVFNPLVLSVLEETTRYSISFAQWTSTGVVLAAVHVPIYYLILKLMVVPEVRTISPSRLRIRHQSEQLGPLGRGEKNVLFVLTVMLALWMLPTIATVEFLDIWYVPPVGMVLLFLLPVDGRRGEMTLDRNDLQEGVAWNVLFLVVGGMAMVSGLTRLGVTDWIGAAFAGNVTATALPWLAGLLTTALTQVASGISATVMVSSMLFPIAEALEYNAAILARIIAGTAHAVALPWSSPTAATTFAAGAVHLGTMFRAGAVATVLTAIAVIVLSMILVPAFEAFGVQ
jgi:sodium-dependent dicarboxylate transporter 2/3/5